MQRQNDDKRQASEETGVEQETLGQLLGASESGPAGQQVENRPGKPLNELLRRLGLTP